MADNLSPAVNGHHRPSSPSPSRRTSPTASPSTRRRPSLYPPTPSSVLAPSSSSESNPPLRLSLLHIGLSTYSLSLAVNAPQVVSPAVLVYFPVIRGVGTIVVCLVVGVASKGWTWARLRAGLGAAGAGSGGSYERVMMETPKAGPRARSRTGSRNGSADSNDFAIDVEDGQGRRTGSSYDLDGSSGLVGGPVGLGWRIYALGAALLASTGPLAVWTYIKRCMVLDIGMGQISDTLIPLLLLFLIPFFALPQPSRRIRSILLYSILIFSLLILPLPSLPPHSISYFLLSIPTTAVFLILLKRLLSQQSPTPASGGLLLTLLLVTLLSTSISILSITFHALIRSPTNTVASFDASEATSLTPSTGRLASFINMAKARVAARDYQTSFSYLWAFVGALDELVLAMLVDKTDSPVKVAMLTFPRGFAAILLKLGKSTERKIGPGRLELSMAYTLVAGLTLAYNGKALRAIEAIVGRIPGLGKLLANRSSNGVSGLGLAGLDGEASNKMNGEDWGNDDPASDSDSSRSNPVGSSATARRRHTLLSLLSFLPLSLFLFRQSFHLAPTPISFALSGALYEPKQLDPPSLDIVISYYDEGLPVLKETMRFMREHWNVKWRQPRFVVYLKNENLPMSAVADAIDIQGADEVRRLENLGREGGTYLSHILIEYNNSMPFVNPYAFQPPQPWAVQRRERRHTLDRRQDDIPEQSASDSPPNPDDPAPSEPDHTSPPDTDKPAPLPDMSIPLSDRAVDHAILLRAPKPLAPRQGAGFADHTFFLQGHLAWNWIAEGRMDFLQRKTGYLSLGPYIEMDCGRDLRGNGDFDRLKEIYEIWEERFCGPEHQLTSYAAQHVVSKKRILANAYTKYRNLEAILNAPKGHWIHNEGTWWHYHGDPGPTNPFLGHALERAWPTIFGCTDPELSRQCGDDVKDEKLCQCWDQ